jgi:hypothetical protein
VTDLWGGPDTASRASGLVIPMKPGVLGDVLFAGEGGEHRLWLERKWGTCKDTLPYVLWCGINPSTANKFQDDLTITKEQRWTAMLGFSRMIKVNLFSLCSTDPLQLITNVNRDHPANFKMISALNRHAAKFILATGAPPKPIESIARDAMRRVRALRPDMECLGVTRDGWPRHSSRLPYATRFEPFRG